jgi:hypothetical protein
MALLSNCIDTAKEEESAEEKGLPERERERKKQKQQQHLR